MRKTSQDGGEYSATSTVENEVKKPRGLLSELKTKKIGKRTAPNLSEESDDAVVEPLLQKSTNSAVQSAKYFAKAKADTVKEITKLFNDKKTQHASTSGFGTTETLLSEKDQADAKTNASNAPLHNHMNTNVFHSLDNAKVNGTTKTNVLVEIDGCKQSGFNPSPLIFTTAKIHTDGKPNIMEPVQMTPAPILSTVEVSVSKNGNIISNEKKISNGTSIMNISFSQPLKPENTANFSTTVKAQESISKSDNLNKPLSTNNTKENKTITSTNKPDKTHLNFPLKTDSLSSTSKLITAATVNIPVATNSKDASTILSEISISDVPKSVAQTTKSSLGENKTLESSPQLPFVSKTHKKENLYSIDSDSISKNKENGEKEDKILTFINIKPMDIEKQTSSLTKPLERQQNITAVEDPLKMENKKDSLNNSECLKESKAKSSSSMKMSSQSKINESKLNTDTDMPLKSNEKFELKSKVPVNNDAIASKESSISPPILKSDHDPLLLAGNRTTIRDSSKCLSLNNPKTDLSDVNVVKTNVVTPKTTTLVTDATNSNVNKVQAKTTKSASSPTYTASSNTDNTKALKTPTSNAEKAISNINKTQAITATSMTDTGSSNTGKTKAVITKGQTSMADKSSPQANQTQSLPIKAPILISDKASSNANKTQAVTTTSMANKPSSKADKIQTTKPPTSISDTTISTANKTQAITSKVPTLITDKANANANKTRVVTATSTADKVNSKADKTQSIPTKALTPISDKNKTQAAIVTADKTGSNTSKSQPVTTKAVTSTGHPTSSKANKTISTKTAIPTNTKPTTAQSTKTTTKPISVSTVSKTSTNKPPSTTSSTKIAQVTSPGSTAKPQVGKIAQVSTTKPTGITSPMTVTAEHSNNVKTNEASNKIGTKSSDQTKDDKVTKAQ